MKKLFFITALLSTVVFADALTDMATKSVTSQVSDKAKSSVVDGMKDQAISKAKEKGTDMAAEQVEKSVGKDTVTKETAKSAIKSVL